MYWDGLVWITTTEACFILVIQWAIFPQHYCFVLSIFFFQTENKTSWTSTSRARSRSSPSSICRTLRFARRIRTARAKARSCTSSWKRTKRRCVAPLRHKRNSRPLAYLCTEDLRPCDRDTDQRRTSTFPASVGSLNVDQFFKLMTCIGGERALVIQDERWPLSVSCAKHKYGPKATVVGFGK